jgi:hypothetical protein
MTKTVTKTFFADKYNIFNESEKDAFFSLLSSNIKRNPQNKRFHEIFNVMFGEKIENAMFHYQESLKFISIADIEPSVAISLAEYKLEPEFGDFLVQYFSDGKSKASKAFNLKK